MTETCASGGNGGDTTVCGVHALHVQTLSDVRNGQHLILGELALLKGDLSGIKATAYGADGTGGVTGSVNWLKGAFAVVCVLLSGILGFSVYNVNMSGKHLAAMAVLQSEFTAHSAAKTHAPEEDLDNIHNGMHYRMEVENGSSDPVQR